MFFLQNYFDTQLSSSSQTSIVSFARSFSFDVEDYTVHHFTVASTNTKDLAIGKLAEVQAILLYSEQAFDVSIATDSNGNDIFLGKEVSKIALFPETAPDHLKVKAGSKDVELSMLVAG
ncbi:MAG: hypothetical protein ABEK59_12005 [Halobacteria archaeon]